MKKFKFMVFVIVVFILFILLIMVGCNNKSNNNNNISYNDGKNFKEKKLDLVIKIIDLGELVKKDIEDIKSVLIVKNSELNLIELFIEISEKENKVVIKVKDKSVLYLGEVVVIFSVKNFKNEEIIIDVKIKL